jgi:sarcosine oxidase subunit gamma
MAELSALARSPLGHLAGAAPAPGGAAPVALRERPFRGLIDLRLDPGDAAAREAAEAVLGLALPPPNRFVSHPERSALWLGPDEFLIVTEPGAEAALAAALRHGLAAHHASVTEVSDGRTTIEIAGPAARDLIAKGCGLDLHPRVFGVGHCAQSGLAKARVALRQIDETPTFEILVERSHAEYLWAWLSDARREFL